MSTYVICAFDTGTYYGLPYTIINVKKLQFIHKLTASDTSKTAKITKKVITPSAHRLNVNVLLSNIVSKEPFVPWGKLSSQKASLAH